MTHGGARLVGWPLCRIHCASTDAVRRGRGATRGERETAVGWDGIAGLGVYQRYHRPAVVVGRSAQEQGVHLHV